MNRNDDSDEFDDPGDGGSIISSLYGILNRRERMEPRSRMRIFLPVAAMLAVFAAVLWYSYPRESARRDHLATPVIKADMSSYKTIPADPGGMEIPHQDSTVFQAIREARRDEKSASRVENLLPEPEQPMAREQLFAGLKTDIESPEAPAVAEISDKSETATEETGMQASVPSAVPEEELPMPAASPSPRPLEKAAATAEKSQSPPAALKPVAKADDGKEAAATEPAAGTPGDYYVQLGSLRTQQDAEKAWKTFQSSFPAELGSLGLRVQKADIADRGTYYRVQGGPVAEAKAKDICQAVSREKPGSCLVVQR